METLSSQHTENLFELLRPYMLIESDVSGISVAKWEVDMVQILNTPDDVLSRDTFAKPTVIFPSTYPDADSLFAESEKIRLFPSAESLFTAREDIRMLRLVPHKSRSMYKFYHGYANNDAEKLAHQAVLAQEVETYFEKTPNFAFVRNMYPYALPPGIDQYIAWMKKMDTPRRQTAEFIAKCVKKLDVEPYDLIVFERSLRTSVKMVKGSFPVYRHVHVWMRSKI